ncbi:MAG: hypothetical protein RL748_1442 [Pseudomonadota bacterium]
MSTQNMIQVERFAAINPLFRQAMRANFGQAVSLFSKEIHLDDQDGLTDDEINTVMSISDAEYEAFSKMAAVTGPVMSKVAGRPSTAAMF